MQNNQECFGIPGRKTPPRSEICLTGAAGNGSTNTFVRVFTTVQKNNNANDINLVQSSVLGWYFQILTPGIYTVVSNDTSGSVSLTHGIVVNGTAPTTTMGTPLTYAQGLRTYVTSSGANGGATSSWTGVLSAGDVVWSQNTSASGPNNDSRSSLSICRISN